MDATIISAKMIPQTNTAMATGRHGMKTNKYRMLATTIGGQRGGTAA
ncbi:hypothetical protein ACJ5NV_10860 [Loktanella agnita]